MKNYQWIIKLQNNEKHQFVAASFNFYYDRMSFFDENNTYVKSIYDFDTIKHMRVHTDSCEYPIYNNNDYQDHVFINNWYKFAGNFSDVKYVINHFNTR